MRLLPRGPERFRIAGTARKRSTMPGTSDSSPLRTVQASATASGGDQETAQSPNKVMEAPKPDDVSDADLLAAESSTLFAEVAISSSTRTKPCAVELLAHQLPGKNTFNERIRWGVDTKLRNQVQLSTYPDCIGGDLTSLRSFCDLHLNGVIGGVHVLPFYPSSADRGFAPLTYKQVDPDFGSWKDIEGISQNRDVCVDFMVNHISAQSEQFKDFVAKGDESEWADLFIRYHKFWGGEPSDEDLARIYTRKPRAPYREVEHPDGTTEKVWCTFDSEQIDIDAFAPLGLKFVEDQLDHLCQQGANLIRLDAFGYTTKRVGTNCFFVEPEVWQLLDRVEAMLQKRSTELLCEVHEHFSMQKRLAENGYWVYDFAMPMLTLQALYDSDATNIKAWWLKCPRNQITTLDTHDGLGVVDVADLMSEDQIERTRENIKHNGANYNMRYNSAEYDNLDIYQINISYYSAVGDRDEWYVLARALQFFTPGIPLVYYVGLLAGANDVERVERTKVGRDINRHEYTLDEAVEETERPVVKVLFELCRFRNNHPAFNGNFELLDTVTDILDSAVLMPEPGTEPAAEPGSPLAPSASLGSVASPRLSASGAAGTSQPLAAPLEAGGLSPRLLQTSGSFRAQQASLMASIDAEESDFLGSVVLDRQSVNVLATIEQGEFVDETKLWSVDQIVADGIEGISGALPGTSGALPGRSGALAGASGTLAAPSGNLPPTPKPSLASPRSSATPQRMLSERSVEERLARSSSTVARGFDNSGHDTMNADYKLADADKPFRPFSAALANVHNKHPFMSPMDLACESRDEDSVPLSPLQQVRLIRQASRRDPTLDLPENVVCCKWTNGAHWAVLEADLSTKDFRIIYVDPFDGRQKVWAVTQTLQVYKDMMASPDK